MGHHMRQFRLASDHGGAVRPLTHDEKAQAAALLDLMEESVQDTTGNRFELAVKELSALIGPLRKMRATAA
jgi:hypothetical protein